MAPRKEIEHFSSPILSMDPLKDIILLALHPTRRSRNIYGHVDIFDHRTNFVSAFANLFSVCMCVCHDTTLPTHLITTVRNWDGHVPDGALDADRAGALVPAHDPDSTIANADETVTADVTSAAAVAVSNADENFSTGVTDANATAGVNADENAVADVTSANAEAVANADEQVADDVTNANATAVVHADGHVVADVTSANATAVVNSDEEAVADDTNVNAETVANADEQVAADENALADVTSANAEVVANADEQVAADVTSANAKDVRNNSRYMFRARTKRSYALVIKRKRKRKVVSKSTSVTVTRKRKRPKYKYKYIKGNYCKQGGGLTVPKGPRSRILPLSAAESLALRSKRVELLPDEDTTSFVYQVRAYKDVDKKTGTRSDWIYVGRKYNSSKDIFLPVEWLNENEMDGTWRQRTILRRVNHWFRVSVQATTHQTRLEYTLAGNGGCIPLSMIKFYKHVGMLDLARQVEVRLSNGITEWSLCIDFMYRAGGFTMTRPLCHELTRRLVVEGQKKVLFVLQLAAIGTTNEGIDNTHAICVFNGLIFDANHSDPLPLTKDNLDHCCLGGSGWTFHHVSRARQFSPSKQSKKRFPVFNEKTSVEKLYIS